jgi:hypothetical protein
MKTSKKARPEPYFRKFFHESTNHARFRRIFQTLGRIRRAAWSHFWGLIEVPIITRFSVVGQWPPSSALREEANALQGLVEVTSIVVGALVAVIFASLIGPDEDGS